MVGSAVSKGHLPCFLDRLVLELVPFDGLHRNSRRRRLSNGNFAVSPKTLPSRRISCSLNLALLAAPLYAAELLFLQFSLQWLWRYGGSCSIGCCICEQLRWSVPAICRKCTAASTALFLVMLSAYSSCSLSKLGLHGASVLLRCSQLHRCGPTANCR